MRIILFVYLVGLRRVLKTAQFWTEFTRCNAAAIKGVDVLLPNVLFYLLFGRSYDSSHASYQVYLHHCYSECYRCLFSGLAKNAQW